MEGGKYGKIQVPYIEKEKAAAIPIYVYAGTPFPVALPLPAAIPDTPVPWPRISCCVQLPLLICPELHSVP